MSPLLSSKRKGVEVGAVNDANVATLANFAEIVVNTESTDGHCNVAHCKLGLA